LLSLLVGGYQCWAERIEPMTNDENLEWARAAVRALLMRLIAQVMAGGRK
jgi:hypothetical protein